MKLKKTHLLKKYLDFMTMETYTVLCCIIVFSLLKVEGWSCVSPVTNVFKRVNTNAILKFDLSGYINRQTVNTVTVKYHDNTVRAAIKYNNGVITYSKAYGVDVTADISGNIVLTIQNVETEGAGIYYISSDSFPTRCSCLYILGAPTKPEISVDNPSVGGSATLSCRSTSTTTPSNHSLGFIYSWRVDNIDNPSDPRYTYSRNTLTLSNIVKEDANKQFKCLATEDVSGGYTSHPSGLVPLNVLYGPENIDFSPIKTSYERAEKTSLGPVTCTANCNPECTFQWNKVDDTTVVSNSAVLDLGMLSSSKAGTYRCTATRLGESATKDLTIDVIYGPYSTSLSPSAPYTGNEGDTDFPSIRCSADCYPACSYTWTKLENGKLTTVQTTNGVLSLRSLSRDDAGNYTCIVTNPALSMSSTTAKSLLVVVRYGPDVAYINVKSPYYVTEGEVSELRCSSDCYPGCSYSWINVTSGSNISSDNVLSFTSVTRYMAGTYNCVIRNTAVSEFSKTSGNSTSVIVRYAPDVNIQVSPPNTTEGVNLTLVCIGHGVPSKYHYSGWTQIVNGVMIPPFTNEKLMGTDDNSSINFPSLGFEDTGLYTCKLNNNVTTTSGVLDQTGSVNVTVRVRPKILSDDLRYTGVSDGMAEVKIHVYSFPELDNVTVTRYNDVDIIQDDKYSFSTYNAVVEAKFYGTSVNLNGEIFNMTINDLVEQDFGNYSITFTNRIGTQVVQISIIAEGPPSSPENFQLLSKQGNPIFIWEKKFNGGKYQRFIIQTSPVGTDLWRNHTSILETDQHYKVNATFYKVEIKLQPGLYNARILSSNEKGESEVVDLDHMLEIKEEKGLPSLQVGTIAGGSVSIVAVIAIVAVVAVVMRRKIGDKKSRLKMSLPNDVDEEEKEDEVTVNPMYVSADEIPPADNTYAQPVKKKKIVKASNVYAMVDKTGKKDKRNDVSLFNKTDASIYENAEDFSSQEMSKAHKESQHTSDTTKSQRIVNKDGLVYVDLVFNDQPKGKKKLVIHGHDNATNYVEVDFSKKADPLPPSDEEDNTTK